MHKKNDDQIQASKIKPLWVALALVCSCSHAAAALQGTAKWIPEDAYVVASIRLGNILEKSDYANTPEWKPILKWAEKILPEIAPILKDPNATGLNLKVPVRLFLRGGHAKDDALAFGALFLAKDKKKVASSLASIAKKANLRMRKDKGFVAYVATGKSIGLAIKGQVIAFVGVAPSPGNPIDASDRVEEVARSLLEKPTDSLPKPLAKHLGKSGDVDLYVNGEGFAKLARLYWPADQWKGMLPAIGPILERKLAARIKSYPGRFILEIEDPEAKPAKKGKEANGLPAHLVDLLPGDAPVVAGLSIDPEDMRSTAGAILTQLLGAAAPEKKEGEDSKGSAMTALQDSVDDLLASPSGHFALALGSFRKGQPSRSPESPPVLPSPGMLFGIGIESDFSLGQFLAQANVGGILDSLLAYNGLGLTRKKDALWLSTPEYRREATLGRPLNRLSKNRRESFSKHPIVAEVNLRSLSRSIRDAGPLDFDLLKTLDLTDEGERITVTGNLDNLKAVIQLRDKEANGWQILGRHLAQEIIDNFNDKLFLAIGRNTPSAVVASIKEGALINAPDRFGHSPMHYAAYKGNAAIVEYLISKGGDPNARGRHDSTPLHSAAWGRNRQVLEVLLENGADVNARTDEGETPGMTASLRGEKETLEILLALSADPHAKDEHGTSLAELAAAGGHKPIFDMLLQIGVKVEHPLHVAAGLGDFKAVKEFLDKGEDVNARDGFGATPLILAAVAGREDMVDFLLERKADPTLPAKDGYSFMHGAAFSGKKSLIRKALSLGMEINARYGPDGITPVDVANEDTDAAAYIRAHGGRTGWELGRP